MHWPMAGNAVRCIRVAGSGRLAMDALAEFLDFIGVALGAPGRGYLGCRGNFVMVAMAGLAGSVAECAVNAVRHMRSLVGMASCAFYLRYFGGVRIILDDGVAVGATQNSVDAGGMPGGINRDALSLVGLHPRLAMAGQAAFVLLQRLRQLRLCPGMGMGWDAEREKHKQEKRGWKEKTESSSRSCRESGAFPQG